MAEKDYADIMFDAISVLIDKKIDAVKFDQTINATIVDATKAEEGVYVVSTGNAKFTAYSTEVEYKNNDAVLVMIPQGNYDNQKMIIGKQVDDTNTPLVYKSPFQRLVNITNNLIQGKKEIGYWANDPTAETGLSWNIDNNDFRTSTIFLAANRLLTQIATASTMDERKNLIDQYNNLVLYDSNFDDTFIPQAEYTQLGLSAQFSTWLADYGTYTGNYGLAIEITFKSLETNINNSFTKIITFDSKEFFGDVYNFETYYTQENVYDISDYTDYPITRLRLFAYQRENFIGANGETVPYNDANGSGNINPNIFIKDPYLCLGIPVEDFNEDMATIMTTSTVTYYKGDLSPNSDYTQRFNDNEKIIGLRWVHKDTENDIIKAVEPDEFPDTYEVRWYRYKLGAQSPDMYAGAHWERLYYPRIGGMDNEGDYYITDPNMVTPELDTFTNELEIRFWPNVNNASEKIKVVIVKNEGTENDPIYRRVAVSNILEFTNETDVRNKASVIDMNALSIQFVDESGEMSDCLGTYFIYDRADKILNDQDKEIRFLQLAFDPNEPNVYQKAELTDWTSIKWYVPCGNDTMIIPATPAGADAKPVQNPNEGDNFTISDQTRIAFFVKPVLNRYSGRNTVRAEVIKDGQSYTAEAQMVFGTSGTSGSDYTIQLVWRHGKNAVDVSQGVLDTPSTELLDGSSLGDRKVLEGELVLYDQNGQNVTEPDFDWELNWKVSERLKVNNSNSEKILHPAYQETDYYYPVYLAEDEYEDGQLVESNFVTFKQGQLDDDKDRQREGHYYYYTLKDIFNNIGLVLGQNGIIASGITNNNKTSIFEKISKFYHWDNEKNYFANCIETYNNERDNNDPELTESSLANSTQAGLGAIDKFLDSFFNEEKNSYKQFYYKTHETELNKKKKQLIFEQMDNVYNGDENNTSLYLGSQAASDVFFKTSVQSISKEAFFNEIQQNAIQYNSTGNFINILKHFAEQYSGVMHSLNKTAALNNQWKIKVGSLNGNTLRNSLFDSSHSSGEYLEIELIDKILSYSNSQGLYYTTDTLNSNDPNYFSGQFYITDTNLNIYVLRELYSLLFDNDAISTDKLKELQRKYFYIILQNADISQELLVLASNSTKNYVYENSGEVVFISPGTKLSCGVLKYLFNADDIKLYEIISNDGVGSQSTTNLKDSLKQNFTDGFSYASGTWESILSRIIDYKEKSKNEIQNTNLSSSYLIQDIYGNSNGLDLKTMLINNLENGQSLPEALTSLDLNNQTFLGLNHSQSALNNCLTSILSYPAASNPDINSYTPGFVQASNYEAALSKEKQKWYLESNFKNINNEEVGSIFVLDAIRLGRMRNFTQLINLNLSTINYNGVNKIVLGRNPEYSSDYDYVNFLFQLQFLLREKQDELLSDIQTKNSNGTISGNNDNAVEYHITHVSSSSEYSNADYIYGKDLFRYIKSYLNSSSGSKYVLIEKNNLGLLFKLIFTDEFYTNLNSSSGLTYLENDMDFFDTYLTSGVIETYATMDRSNETNLGYIGNFTKDSSYYTNNFKSTVSEEPNGTLDGWDYLTYCALKSDCTTYRMVNGQVALVDVDTYGTPTITINKTDGTITYTGTVRIVTEDSNGNATGSYSLASEANSLLPTWIKDSNYGSESTLFTSSNALSLRSGAKIYSLYDFRKNGNVIIGYYVGDRYFSATATMSPDDYQYLINYYQVHGTINQTPVYSSGPFCYTTYNLSKDSSYTWVLESSQVSSIGKSEVKYNGGSFDNLQYITLFSRFFPNNGSYPDFTSLLMKIIIGLWRSVRYDTLTSLFGYSYVRKASGSSNVFGQSNTLIFFPYETYGSDLTYFASINKILQSCIDGNSIDQVAVYEKVLLKLRYSSTIMELTDDTENLFYIMLMSMLYNSPYNDVDQYYQSTEEQIQLNLNILLSKAEIFWQCYDYVPNVDYPQNDSSANYRNQQNVELNLLREFSVEANTNWMQVKDILPTDLRDEQLKTLMFSLLRSYYQRKNFYQYQQITNNLEDVYNYIANLCFKEPLDEDIYIKACCNVQSNQELKDTNTAILLKNLYLGQSESFNNNIQSFITISSAFTAEQWVTIVTQSMQYLEYRYDKNNLAVGTNYNYYVNINEKLEKIKDLLLDNNYGLQELYTYICYSDFYIYRKDNESIVSKDIIADKVIENNQNVIIINGEKLKDAIPQTEEEILSAMLQGFIANKNDDILLYETIINAIEAEGLDIVENQWYYKIKNGQVKELVNNLFKSDIDSFLQEILNIINNATNFYNIQESASGEIYFNYYNIWNKKAFIKRSGVYILDPEEEFSLYETYYYPLQTTKEVNSDALLIITHQGDNTFTIQPDPSPRENETIDSDALLHSLNILQVTLKHFGDYDLISYFPIPLKNGTQGTNSQISYQVRYIEGADRVWYPITGEPEYYQNPYRLFAQKYENNILTNFEEPKESLIWEPIYYKKDNEIDNFTPSIENNILKPIVVYVKQAKNYGVICKKGNVILWSQPILVYQDRYPSTTVNKWNGTDIVLDDKTGMILASAFAAGKKEDDNSFSGVLLGDFSRDVSDPSISAQTGIYGFHYGRPSYAFLEDGKGYIGKEGKGRIWFDGEDSQIYSGNWKGTDNLGMLLDIDDGYIKMHQYISGYEYQEYASSEIPGDITGQKEVHPITKTASGKSNITIDSRNHSYPLQIGLDDNNTPSFKVGWAGDVHIERGSLNGAHINGSLITGSDVIANYVQANHGWLGGWVINSGKIQSPPDGSNFWTILNPYTGITTNRVKISTKSEVKEDENEQNLEGVLGLVKGHNGIEETNAIGIASGNIIIIKSSGNNVGIKSAKTLYLEGTDYANLYLRDKDGHISIGKAPNKTEEGIFLEHSNIFMSGNKLTVESTEITVKTTADNQHGIYARFA